jgi:tetratricopeptide (TPR) repeat protein
VAAYEALAKGLLNLRSESYEALDRAVLFFERAVALDSGYARLTSSSAPRCRARPSISAHPSYNDRAIVSLLRALELKPGSARALARPRRRPDHRRADRRGHRAPRAGAGPRAGGSAVLAGMARSLFLGRADFAGAARFFERALEHSPHAGWYWLQLSHCSALLRDFARASAQRSARCGCSRSSSPDARARRSSAPGCASDIWRYSPGEPPRALAHFQQELAFLQRVEHALRGRITIELHLRLGAARRALGHEAEAAADFATAIDAYERRVALGGRRPVHQVLRSPARTPLRGETESALSLLERRRGGAAGVYRGAARDRARV